ncbi:MAG TPA: ATP-binding protein [Galbitalea sp.]|jgi:hypothetical protein
MLSLEAHAQVLAFSKFKVAHPKLVAADATIRQFVHEPADTAILLVAGPTGAGKTTLKDRVIEKLAAEFESSTLPEPPSPPVAFDCPAPAGTTFAWGDWLAAGLEALRHPAPREIVHVPADPRVAIETGSRRNIGAMRRNLVTLACDQRVAAIGNDEAQHLAAVGRRGLVAQLEMIKSLADAVGVPFILFGTYTLLELRNLSGQLGRRCQDVHFPRYRIDDAQDWTDFKSVVHTFAQELPIDEETLLGDPEWIYLRSAGCIGTLKQWLTRALVASLEDGTGEITRAQLEKKALSVAALTAIAEEITVGEREFEEDAASIAVLEGLIGRTVVREPIEPKAPRKRAGRVGHRNPKRDQTAAAA